MLTKQINKVNEALTGTALAAVPANASEMTAGLAVISKFDFKLLSMWMGSPTTENSIRHQVRG